MIFSGGALYCRRDTSKQIFSSSSRGRWEARLFPGELERRSRAGESLEVREGDCSRLWHCQVPVKSDAVSSSKHGSAVNHSRALCCYPLPLSKKNPKTKLLEYRTHPAKPTLMAWRRPHTSRFKTPTKSHQNIVPTALHLLVTMASMPECGPVVKPQVQTLWGLQ